MKSILFTTIVFLCTQSFAAFIELQDTDEFEQLIGDTQLPLIVQFNAYFCPSNEESFEQLASDFAGEVEFATVDAYLNPELRKYLDGRYPTVRTFFQGNLLSKRFIGKKSIEFIQDFTNELIADPTPRLSKRY